MFKRIFNSLFAIKAHAYSEDEFLEEEDDIKVEESDSDKELKLIVEKLSSNGLNGCQLDNETLEFSFITNEGSNRYAEDYNYFQQNNDDSLPVEYDDYKTKLRIKRNTNGTYEVSEKGYTTMEEAMIVSFKDLLGMIDSNKWQNVAF